MATKKKKKTSFSGRVKK